MPKWSKNETDFSVSISSDGKGSHVCRIPKPILKILNNPNSIRFVVDDEKIIVKIGKK